MRAAWVCAPEIDPGRTTWSNALPSGAWARSIGAGPRSWDARWPSSGCWTPTPPTRTCAFCSSAKSPWPPRSSTTTWSRSSTRGRRAQRAVPRHGVRRRSVARRGARRPVPARSLASRSTSPAASSARWRSGSPTPTSAPCRTAHRSGSSTATSRSRTCSSAVNGVPKLVDFGLAKLTGHSLTEPGVVRGRPRTLSPEQARGDKRHRPLRHLLLGRRAVRARLGGAAVPQRVDRLAAVQGRRRRLPAHLRGASPRGPTPTWSPSSSGPSRSIPTRATAPRARWCASSTRFAPRARSAHVESVALARLVGRAPPQHPGPTRHPPPRRARVLPHRAARPTRRACRSSRPPSVPTFGTSSHVAPVVLGLHVGIGRPPAPRSRTAADALRTPVADEVRLRRRRPARSTRSEPPEPVTGAVERPAGLDESEEASPAGSTPPARAPIDACAGRRSGPTSTPPASCEVWGVRRPTSRRRPVRPPPDAVTLGARRPAGGARRARRLVPAPAPAARRA
jgi:hypothetical protein